MNDRPTVVIFNYWMKGKPTGWLLVFVSQTVKIRWITEGMGEIVAYRLSNFLSYTVNLFI